ncbi:unnamed protein product [Orchesella dallaii]|uniref:Uncharacterized protein n=1 Tax=Orchesella dallaii TaxID=48710 RepID=A0ABP1S1G4_9HEXA
MNYILRLSEFICHHRKMYFLRQNMSYHPLHRHAVSASNNTVEPEAIFMRVKIFFFPFEIKNNYFAFAFVIRMHRKRKEMEINKPLKKLVKLVGSSFSLWTDVSTLQKTRIKESVIFIQLIVFTDDSKCLVEY